jgi:hypothetical protein
MKTYLECIPCFTRQTLDAIRMVTDDENLQLRIMRRVLEETSRFPQNTPPPAMGGRIHEIIREETGSADPYNEIKRRANQFALDRLPALRKKVQDSANPFETALRLSIAGNIMDWGAKPHADVSEEAVDRILEECLSAPLHGCSPESLRQSLLQADTVLYLADNAGEIVLDRLFIEFMPSVKMTLAVKSGPAINDATLDDAQEAGLTERVEVIGTGNQSPGTLLDQCSSAFRKHFSEADLVISKGQGNYEALSNQSRRIVFLLKAKCPVVARDLDREIGDMVLLDNHPDNPVGTRKRAPNTQ